MRLNAIQNLLERLYHVKVEHAVEDFLITDPDVARRLDSSPNAREIKEKLLVSQDEEELHLALYLEAAVLERLGDDNPLNSLHGENLPDFLLALEGVSHFLYLIWNAGYSRGVTLMELEMQAEVDKFVAASALFSAQGADLEPGKIRWCLFDAPSYDEQLDEEQHSRYRDASRFAGKYCHRLEHHYLRRSRKREMMRELRHFYRLSQAEKIRLIDSAA